MKCFNCKKELTNEKIEIKYTDFFICPDFQCRFLTPKTETFFIFSGGLPDNPKKGALCVLGFQFETDKKFFLVKFKDSTSEICNLENLKIYNPKIDDL